MIILKKRIGTFLKDNIPAHIVTKDGSWLNGYIVKVYSDYFDFLDRKKGKIPIFFIDIELFEFFNGDMNSLKKEGWDDVHS